MTRFPTAVATLWAGATLAAPAWAQTTTVAYVLDAGAPALVAIDVASGKRTAGLPLTGAPSWLVRSEDGRYVVVLDDGPGERKGQRGYKATGRSSATIADAASLSAVGRVELGFGLESVLTGADGRLTVVTAGYDAKDPRESLPRELVVVDLASARETGRLPLEAGTDLTWRSADGRTLALLQGQPRTAKYPFPQSKVTIVDVAGPTVTATLDAGGWDIAERDADRLYLIRRGRPDKNPAKNQNGVVDVVSFAGRTVDRVDIGRAPIGCLLAEGGLMAVASEGAAGGPAGELRVLREGKLVATLPVAARPAYAAFHAGSIYVVGAKAVTAVDPRGPEVTATIPLAKGAEAIVDDDDQPFELAVTSDSRRAFVHYPAQDKVAVLDLEQKQAIGSTKTGRGGKKFLNIMAAGLTQGMYGRIHFYNPGDPPQMLVRPDGRFAYALNLDTGDVTIVDAGTAAAVEKIGTGGGRALFRLGESTLVVLGPELHVIDTSRNAKIDQLRLPGLRDFALAPDGASAVALAERTVLILDGTTRGERARLTDLVKPTRVVFAPTPSPAMP